VPVASTSKLVEALVLVAGLGLGLAPGDSLGGDMTGLVSGVGVGVADCVGLAELASAHGLVAAGELCAAVAAGDGEESGLAVAVGEAVALTEAEAVALAVADGVGLGNGLLGGAAVGEPDADEGADGDGTARQDETGMAAAARDGL